MPLVLDIGDKKVSVITSDDLTSQDLALKESRAVLSKLLSRPFSGKSIETLKTDASGNLSINSTPAKDSAELVFRAPDASRVRINRLVVESPSYTPLTPYSGGYMVFIVGGVTVLFLPVYTTITIPAIYETPNAGIELRGGEELKVYGAGFAASIDISISVCYDEVGA